MGAARIFTLTTPYAAADLDDLGWEQTAGLMFLTHPSYAPQELRWYGHASWTLRDAAFKSYTAAPTGGAAVAHVVTAGSPTAQVYEVTAIDDATGRESLPSASFTCNNDLGVDVQNRNDLTWAMPAGASLANVFKSLNGVFGYIGTSADGTFKDDNVAPDASDTPPGDTNPFDAADNYPARVTFHEQRAIFARTNTRPNGVFGTQSADYLNMNYSRPAKASDAFSFGLVARQVCTVEHLVPLKGLLALTATGVFSIRGQNGYIDQTPIITPEAYRGSSKVRPVVVDEIAFYNTSKGNQIRTLGYEFARDGYRGNDVTVFASHFFKSFTIGRMAWAENPTSTLWCVRSDGKLIALTWQAEQEVWGWSLCETDGVVEDVAVITEDGEDVAYFVVARTVGGLTKRYTERLASPIWDELDDYVGMDCSLAYDGDPVGTFTGLGHLEGRTVVGLVDGNVYSGLVVTNRSVTLPEGRTGSRARFGLPFEAWLHSLPIVNSAAGAGSSASRKQMVADLMLLVDKTRGIEAAPGKMTGWRAAETSDAAAAGEFFPCKVRLFEGLGSAIDPYSGYLNPEIAPADWSEATVIVRQRQPLPFTLLGLETDVEYGS